MLLFGRKKEEKKKEEKEAKEDKLFLLPGVKFETSFTAEDVERAKSELRVSSLERELLGETLTRFYEAAGEGKLTESERDMLISKYKEQVSKLDSVIDRGQNVLSLHELETMRSELVKMFNDKFGEVNIKIEDIRKRLGVTPKITEVRVAPPPPAEKITKRTQPLSEKPAVSEPPSPAPRRTKADEVLEKLRQDLQKELEKLEQIEMET